MIDAAPLTQELAGRILARAAVPPTAEARATIARALLDTLGVAVAGWRLPSTHIAYDTLSVTSCAGTGRIAGLARPAAPTSAAFMNGLLAHAQLFDDNSDPMVAHPSGPLVAVLLALGPGTGADAERLLRAYACGFETSVSLGRLLNPAQYDRGWHTTATIGVFGAAAAASVLLGSTKEQMTNALGLAVSAAAGVRENFGTMAMGWHAGRAAEAGTAAALMARGGFTASPRAFEGKYGYFATYGAPAGPRALDGFGTELLGSGIQFKLYPSGAPTLCAVQAAVELAPQLAAPVDAVRCRVDPWYAKTLKEDDPTDAFSAKVNLRYCVAAALTRGRLSLDEFDDDALGDAEIRRVMRCTTVEIDPKLTGTFPARVEVFAGGRTAVAQCLHPRGAPNAPPSDADLIGKFCACSSEYTSPERAGELAAAILDFERLSGAALYDVLALWPHD